MPPPRVSRKSGDAGQRHLAARCDQADQLRLAVDVPPGGAGLHPNGPRAWRSTCTPVMADRSMTSASSSTALPATW
jgi:hypothetical protein